jgi:hypothetical protein
MTRRAPCSRIEQPAINDAVPFHCGNDCPMADIPKDYSAENVRDLYPCGWRHWCPWCGDCEYCNDEGPHEWD